jgi:hypothetical protein
MAESSKPKSSGGGCLGKLVALFLLVLLGLLGTAVFFITQPQDLSDVGGYGPSARAVVPRDMKTVLKNSLDRGFSVTLTETEINQWLGRTLTAKQGGPLGSQVSLERVWVRLEDERAEIIMERKIAGMPFTVSMYVKIEQLIGPKGARTEVQLDGGKYNENIPYPPIGGRFGKLVVPQGFLILVRPSYEKLAAVFKEEIHLAFEEMARIKIERKRLVLDPREPEEAMKTF